MHVHTILHGYLKKNKSRLQHAHSNGYLDLRNVQIVEILYSIYSMQICAHITIMMIAMHMFMAWNGLVTSHEFTMKLTHRFTFDGPGAVDRNWFEERVHPTLRRFLAKRS